MQYQMYDAKREDIKSDMQPLTLCYVVDLLWKKENNSLGIWLMYILCLDSFMNAINVTNNI